MILVSPTEPAWLREIGRSSSVPERYGCDVLILPDKAGIQRKTLADLVASLHDGRLAKEAQQMSRLDRAVLLLEGRGRWSTDGEWIDGYTQTRFTRASLVGLMLSLQLQGIWVVWSESATDTVRVVEEIERWLAKPRHSSLSSRPKNGRWGRRSNKAWAVHFFQGFTGIGPATAEAIVDHLGVPLRWTVGVEELLSVPGIGKVRAQEMVAALQGGVGA